MGEVGVWVELERLTNLGDTFGITASEIIGTAKIDVAGEGERIELQRTFYFGNGAIEISYG